MSPATIDRYLAAARAKDPLRGRSMTKPSPLLRSSITGELDEDLVKRLIIRRHRHPSRSITTPYCAEHEQ